MTSERRYLLALTFSREEFPFVSEFINATTTIEGDFEAGLSHVRDRVIENYAREGIRITRPVVLLALELSTLRPPEWVELPIMVKRSLEQITEDVLDKGRPPHVQSVRDVRAWLESIKEDDN